MAEALASNGESKVMAATTPKAAPTALPSRQAKIKSARRIQYPSRRAL